MQSAESVELPGRLRVLVAEEVLFPSLVIPIAMPVRPLRALLAEIGAEGLIGVVARSDDGTARRVAPHTDARPAEHVLPSLYDMGCVGRVLREVKLPGRRRGLMVAGVRRMQIERYLLERGRLMAEGTYPAEEIRNAKRVEALMRNVRSALDELTSLSRWTPEDISRAVADLDEPGQLADFVATSLPLTVDERQGLLSTLVVDERLRRILGMLMRETDLARLGLRVQEEIRQAVEQSQRENYLRAQLRAIRAELGEDADDKELDLARLRERIVELPEVPRARAERELEHATQLSTEAAEYHSIRTYLDWLVALPWDRSTDDTDDIARAAQSLERSHFGLEEIKERIVEFLAVRRLRPERTGAILCLVGPPGVGKTSLGQAIATCLGRRFCRVSLGGMRDEAEIRGHRRTYVGAMPGRVLQSLHRVGSNNPVFMLDEMDKVGAGWRGDPASALLEVLDPVQNEHFLDFYLDAPFDLSRVLFIATANVEEEIPDALRDRMEVIRIAGYIDAEKLVIATRHLLPRQRRAHGLQARQLRLRRRAIREIITGYTEEAGVRELERQIGRVCRKVAAEIALGRLDPGECATVDPDALERYLGPRRFARELELRSRRAGVATGLAWTPEGGCLLCVESTLLPGRGRLKLTGLLGKVMHESAAIALSHIQSSAASYGVDQQLLARHDIHVHIPEGAVPKDGPSAGITLAAAMISLLRHGGRGQRLRSRVAMSGELTLTGAVLPVGGIKEKVIAAQRASLRTLILPADNAGDLRALAPHLKRGLSVTLVREMSDVLAACFPPRG